MSNCDGCGEKLSDDYYYLSFAHSKHNEEGHLYFCKECFFEIRKHLTKPNVIKLKKIKKMFDNSTYNVSFELPDGYKIIRGNKNEE